MMALVFFAAPPARAEAGDPARVRARLETAAEIDHDARIREGTGAIAAGVLFAGAGVASWVSPSDPDDRTARDVVGGVLVGAGAVFLACGAYTVATRTELERLRDAHAAARDDEAARDAERSAERALVARAAAARTERMAEAVAAFVFGALEIGGGILLQARSDDDGLVWLGRGLVAGGVASGIVGVASLAVRSEHERALDAWQRDAVFAPRPGIRIGLGAFGVTGTF